MNLTYRELLKEILSLPFERLDDNVYVHLLNLDEYYPVLSCEIVKPGEDDALDEGCLFLNVHQ